VVVLTGGTSAEREICLKSGAKVFAALDPGRYQAASVDLATITQARAAELARILFAPVGEAAAPPTPRHDGRPEVVFIALHGGAGENGTVQAMLDLLDIPYTGSGVLASAMALNKVVAKKLFEREGIPTPKWMVAKASRRAGAAARIVAEVGLPCVVKPVSEGSSIGVTIVREEPQLAPALDLAFRYGPEAFAEQFIRGVEITGPVLGNEDPEVLPLVEIVPSEQYEFYDYQAKYTPGATDEIIPARITEAQAARACALTLAAHQALGCRGMSRVDMMVGPDDVYVLEIQTIPGLTDTSLLPRAAEAAGITFPRLVDRLIELALEGRERHG
jgi:D-alanine-D-alanine ligase